VSNLPAFTEWIEEIGDCFTSGGEYEAPWFRGTGDARYHLVPGLYRSEVGRRPESDDELRGEFARKGLPMVAERAPRNQWEWYFLMQHYRAPTRLLDWTDAGLVALYFALSAWSPPPGRRAAQVKPAVWAVDPWELNRKAGFQNPVSADSGIDQYLPRPFAAREAIPQYPIAIDPDFVAQRMLVQHSHFTLHGHDQRGIDQMEELGLDRSLFQVVVDFDEQEIDRWRWHLTLAGITETTVFPDLEGLARELRNEYQIG
jgi:hypothetical protein